MKHQNTADLSAVTAPVSKARGLPNEHYVDEGVFAEERQALLFDNWAGVGFGKDIPNEGDANPIDFLGVPLLAVRDSEGQVSVYQNTCRHRGMILVDKPSNIRGSIRCPYHSWCYGLDGSLRSTPHVGAGGGKSHFNLEVKTNWKLAVENYCESYHLPWIHPGLNSYSRLEDHYHIEEPGDFSGQGTYVYRQMEGENGLKFPDFGGLPEFWDEGAEYVSAFPNVLFGAQRDHGFAMILMPKSLDETLEMTGIYYAFDPEKRPEYANMIEKNAIQWRSIFEEDIFVVEGMQKGRHGPHFDGGKFSPVMDNPTHVFHEWAASKLMKARTQA